LIRYIWSKLIATPTTLFQLVPPGI
jgi:hypothetical protein